MNTDIVIMFLNYIAVLFPEVTILSPDNLRGFGICLCMPSMQNHNNYFYNFDPLFSPVSTETLW
jgi:hypothetical protein